MNGAATSAFSLQSMNTGPCGLRSKGAAACRSSRVRIVRASNPNAAATGAKSTSGKADFASGRLRMASLGAGLSTVIIAIAVTRVPLSTRVVRSMVLSVKELSYVEAAGALGATGARVMTRHVAPQCVAPFLIITTGHLGAAIFIEAALSFVGVGVPPPTPSWGNMLGGVLAEAFKPPWWMVVFPGTAITVTILAVNLFGDALRDFLDPKLQ